MPQIYVLFEHAAGFAVFRTTEFEEVAVFLPQVRQSILDISKFRSVVYLVAFQPFKKQKDALENMKRIVEGELSKDLQLFLENNIPRTKKSKQTVVLGVQEAGLASVISDKLGVNCITSGVVVEICRGIRFHFHKLVKGFKDINTAKITQLALAHHYSRGRVNYDSKRHDSMIIQSLNLMDELEKDIRTFATRIRGWYSSHFPELAKIIGDNAKLYVKCVDAIGDRRNLSEDIEERLNILIGETSKVQAILQAVHNSMGMDIAINDLENMIMFCQRTISLIKQQQSTEEYLKAKMKMTAPNISTLVGEMVGSRLISRAGGLSNLAKLPASTVQVLGAEKNFFRTLKGRENPAWGELAKTSFMGKMGKKKKGRMSRFLANKCSLASRVDYFKRTSSDGVFGCSVLQQVEDLVDSFKNSNKKVNGIVDKDNSVQIFNVGDSKEIKSTQDVRMKNLFNSDDSLNSGGEQNTAISFMSVENPEKDSGTESSSENYPKPAIKSSRGKKIKNEENFAISGVNKENPEVSNNEIVTPLRKKRKLKKK